jgi:hypothetical protein
MRPISTAANGFTISKHDLATPEMIWRSAHAVALHPSSRRFQAAGASKQQALPSQQALPAVVRGFLVG